MHKPKQSTLHCRCLCVAWLTDWCLAGTDISRVKQLKAAGTLSPQDLRLFVGEAHWVGQQLEHELAQGKWLLVSPQHNLLQEFALRPLKFGTW